MEVYSSITSSSEGYILEDFAHISREKPDGNKLRLLYHTWFNIATRTRKRDDAQPSFKNIASKSSGSAS